MTTVREKNLKQSTGYKAVVISILAVLCVVSTVICVAVGSVDYTVGQVVDAFLHEDAQARLIVWNVRLPRILCGGIVGICLSLAGCILQGVMRNHMASPSTIGVTSGASFVGYMMLVVFPQYYHLLPVGAILGSFATTMVIYMLAYDRGVSPVKMILSGMAVSAVFGAFNDMIKIFFAERLADATGFMVGSLNGVSWESFQLVLPYTVVGVFVCFFLPAKMNILMLGDEMANTLGLRTEHFRLFLIAVSSLLAGTSIAAAGMISFVGLIVPHISRLMIGSDYKYLFPTSIFLGYSFVVICDTVGRVILPVGNLSVSVVLSFIGAPFFLYLLRKKDKTA
ncbi:MAG: iron ABC transporter permease [Oscillospiraceae bacterium]|nr:iron ABC transporter permease [Oscillospiraceae bacterium]